MLGFDVARDLLQLDHNVYTHLLEDTTPKFAVAVAATSATDYLFYNSATGGLFYDADGSGSPAALLANLDTGLALTAKDIVVV